MCVWIYSDDYHWYTIGLLNMYGYEEQFVVQGVHMLFDGCKGARWGEGVSRRSVLVIIGVNLDQFELEQGLLRCVYIPK